MTAQRLKGLTTGSLPTFFEVKSSFASELITSDNILSQYYNNNLRINFMGDDTWNGLFNITMFKYNNPYPSFDVYDLYTVDDGCKMSLNQSLYNETMLKNWDILISHFLGVDHVGHRYYMNHPKMNEKLHEMDNLVNDVISYIKNYKKKYPNKDILFLIMGDHGMTYDGNHGGATKDETNAALFYYSTKNLYPYTNNNNNNDSKYRSISQINIVPTLSLLMGVPIPFQNIGSVITDLYVEMNENDNNDKLLNSYKKLLKALWLNTLQVYEYLITYHQQSNGDTFTVKDMHNLNKLFNESILNLKNIDRMFGDTKDTHLRDVKAQQLNELKNGVNIFEKFLKWCYDLCLVKWTTFEVKYMLFGIFIGLMLFIGLICMLIEMETSSMKFTDVYIIWLDTDLFQRIKWVSIFIIIFLVIKYALFYQKLFTDYIAMIIVFLEATSVYIIIVLWKTYFNYEYFDNDFKRIWNDYISDFDTFATIVGVIIYFQGLFTDTYIRFEKELILFVFIFGLVCRGISNLRDDRSISTSIASRVRSDIYISQNI